MTYYDILEISENASDEVVRMAYKALAKKYHPDVFKGDPKEAEEKMKQINEAFEILSDNQKRKQYDDSLHKGMNETYADNASDVQSDPVAENNSNNGFKFPSGAKSGWIIGILLFIGFTQVLHPYIESDLYDYALVLGLIDFCLLNVLIMIVPMLVGIIKTDIKPKGIKILSAINSLVIYGISLILYLCEVINAMLIGWIIAILYYFINKHILLQIKKHSCSKRRSLISLFIILAIFISMIVGGMFLRNYLLENDNLSGSDNQNSTLSNSKNPLFYVDATGEIYDLEGYDRCAIVRTIALGDKFTAEYVYALMQQENFDEEKIIAIMDEFGSDQMGGTGHLIKPGEFVEEIDEWCFDENRVKGDTAIIENPYGYSICYFVYQQK